MSLIARQIVLTLAYSQQFSYPLTAKELWLRLLAPTDEFLPITAQSFVTGLLRLTQSKKLSKHGRFFVLPGHQSSAAVRARRLTTSQKKRQELEPLLILCRWIPWVCGVAITGSLAMNNADEHADADIMIITENNRLWLVRPLLVLFSFLYGKRRSWNKEEENSWCLNLWLERRSLAVPLSQRSVYTAHEVIQADWRLSKGGTAKEFYLANRWVDNYLFHHQYMFCGEYGGWLTVPVLQHLMTVANFAAFTLQKWYMKPHMTQERVQLSSAFFHPRDTRSLTVKNWRRILREL